MTVNLALDFFFFFAEVDIVLIQYCIDTVVLVHYYYSTVLIQSQYLKSIYTVGFLSLIIEDYLSHGLIIRIGRCCIYYLYY